MRGVLLAGLLAVSLNSVGAQAATSSEEWASRTIYQLLTDRFGNPASQAPCKDLHTYCGGTFAGVVDHLDYIQDMGFDAIWISPIPVNTPNGYHGYWAQDLNAVNPHFGGSEELQSLVSAAHSKDIMIMLDVVGNHMGPVCTSPSNCSFNILTPFDSASDFHSCDPCPKNCQIQNFKDQSQTELCRLAGLPDLNQSNPSVAQKLTSWVKTTVQKYNIDGLRIDTVPEVDKSFWSAFVASAGIYAVGEVFNGNPQYVGSYQKPNGPIPGVLSYPLFFTLRNVFAKQQSMNQIQSMEKQYKQDMGNLSYIASFVDNHDNPRFLFENPDKTLYKNALLYGLFATGIPIVYYGSEQGFDGGNDPLNREVLWPTKYSESGDLYKFIKTAVGLRKTLQVWEHPQVQRYSTTNFYAFTRGTALVALTNVGSQGQPVTETISYQPYKNGTKLCDQLNTANCVVVQNGKFQVTLTSGMCAVFTPQS